MKHTLHSLQVLLCALAAFHSSSHAATSITSDGTLGTTVAAPIAIPDVGNLYNIDGGTYAGTNQFHSLGDFSIDAGDIASFNGVAGTANIISRVTGGNLSTIDGTVGSTIAGANLFILNPAGVLIGPNAQLAVDGSFHISTADYLNLSDGGLFFADPSGTNNLTTAPPAAFGFLSAAPASIDIYTANFNVFQVASGETLSFVGGDMTIGAADGSLPAFMMAPGGTINMISVASTGEAIIEADSSISTDNFNQLGNILLQGNSIIDAKNVYVRAGQFVIDDGLILPGAMSFFGLGPAPDGGIIDIDVANEFIIRGTGTSPYLPQRPGLAAFAGDFATGVAPAADVPDILVNAGSVLIEGTGIIEVARMGAGGAGSITINADTTVELLNGGTISVVNAYEGAGTPITINAEDITLDGSGSSEVTRIAASSGLHPAYPGEADPALTTATGGTITINASNNLVVRNAQITAEGQSFGGSSDITLTAKNALFDSQGVIIGPGRTIVSTQSSFAGDSGNINLTVEETLDIIDGAVINVSTLGSGDGGDLNVTAGEINILGEASGLASQSTPLVTEQLDAYAQLFGTPDHETLVAVLVSYGLLAPDTDGNIFDVLGALMAFGVNTGITDFVVGDGGNINVATSNLTISGQDAAIDSSTGWDGNAGNVAINVDNLVVSDGASISSRSGVARIDTGELYVGAGNGGDVSIIANNSVTLESNSSISASSLGDGTAGNISVTTSDMALTDSSVTSRAEGTGNGGQINLVASNSLVMDNASISASSLGAGFAGDISVDAGNILEMTGSSITSQAEGAGDGGDITVVASDSVTLESNSSISASSLGDGTAGNISVTTSDMALTNSSVTSRAEGTGNGGQINLVASNSLVMDNASISASSLGAGFAGDIFVDAGNILEMSNSSITTEALESDGGNITVMAIEMIYMDDSEISTSVGNGFGKGGDINIDPEFFILQESNIVANAFGGPGGNINIIAQNFLASSGSLVDASSVLNTDGIVNIEAPDENVSEDLTTLPDNYLDVSSLLSERCGAAAGASSLVNAGPDGLAVDPDGYLPSFVASNSNKEEGENNSVAKGKYRWSPYAQQKDLQLAQVTCTF